MAKKTYGASGERYDPALDRWVPTGFTGGHEYKGSLDEPKTVKTTSLRNLADAIHTFRSGR
jgi:hypothetical protein